MIAGILIIWLIGLALIFMVISVGVFCILALDFYESITCDEAFGWPVERE
jgi:hypothetical protein